MPYNSYHTSYLPHIAFLKVVATATKGWKLILTFFSSSAKDFCKYWCKNIKSTWYYKSVHVNIWFWNFKVKKSYLFALVEYCCNTSRKNMPAAKYSKISLTEKIYFDQMNKYFNQERKYNLIDKQSSAFNASVFNIVKQGKSVKNYVCRNFIPSGA